MKINKFKNKNRKKNFSPKHKTLKNPLFDKSQSKSLWKKLNNFFLILIFLGVGYLILFSPLFFINKVKIQGSEEYNQDFIKKTVSDQLNTKLYFILPQNNILIFSKKEFYKSFENNPYLKEISLKKKLFHTLAIDYQIRQPEFLIFNKSIYWLVDREGYVLSVLDKANSFIGPKIFDPNHVFKVADRINYKDNLNKYKLVWDDFVYKYKGKGILPKQINLSADMTKFDLITNKNWKIMFSTDYDVEKQLNVLYELLTKKIENYNDLNYIDLRIENWVYYK